MAAATANRDGRRRDSDLKDYQVGASTVIFKHTLVSVRVADGLAYPARSGTATDIFVGVAYEPANNNGGGQSRVNVLKTGEFEFIGSGFAATDAGAAVYAADDQTLTKTATNNQLVGYVTEVISATRVRVRIDNAVR